MIGPSAPLKPQLKSGLGLWLVLLFGWLIAFLPAPLAAKAPVYVTASFVDKRGLFIEDLNREEVQVFENDQSHEVEFIARDEIPVVYGLIFDLSMLPEGQDVDYRGSRLTISAASAARSMAYDLIDKHLREQTIWVGGYQKELRIVQDFTTDGFTAKDAIQRMHGARGPAQPFLYSALFSGIMKMNTRTEKRRVLIIFMDALDQETLSRLKPLTNLLSSSNVELFIVSFAGKMGSDRGGLQPAMSQSSLKQLAQVTSGEAFFAAEHPEHFEDIIRPLYNQIRTFYTFGFETSSEESFRLTIRCTRPGCKVKCHPTVATLSLTPSSPQ